MVKIFSFKLIILCLCGMFMVVVPVQAATRTISNTGGNWSATTAWVEGIVPTSADDVVATATSGNLTLDINVNCNSINLTGYTGILTHNSNITLSIGSSNPGANNNALVFPSSGWTYSDGSAGSTAHIAFISTSSTQQKITSGGKSLPSVQFNGVGGSWQLQDDLKMIGNFTYTAGIFDTNAKIITLSNGNITFSGGGQTYYELDLTGSQTATISGANTFTNLNRTSTAAKMDILSLSANQTVTGILTFAGNSAINRLLVQSDTLGVTRTITNTGATMTWSNVDFKDIALSNSFDASAITGKSGDCGGNSSITFTTGATETWFGTAGGNWSTNAWSGRVPLCQDNVSLAKVWNASQTITADMPRLGRNITFSGASGTPTLALVSLGSLLSTTIYGSLTLISGMTFAPTGSSSQLTFEGRGSFTLTTGGKTFYGVIIQMVGGTLTLQDNLSTGVSGGTLRVINGTLNANNRNITTTGFNSSNSNTRTITMGSGTWTIGRNGWNVATTTGLTFNANTSTITVSTLGSSVNFASGGLTYYNINTSTLTASDTILFSGNFTVSGTLTLNGVSAASRLLVMSNTIGTAVTITAAALSISNTDFEDITGAGAANWDLHAAVGKSGDCGGNSGITFTAGATQTWQGTSGGNWSANAWTSRVPLCQDNVVINAAFSASQTITVDVPRWGKSVDFTGTTGSPTISMASYLGTIYGSLTLVSGLSFSGGFGAQFVLDGRSALTITTAGNSLNSLTLQGSSATWTLQDNLAVASNGISINGGILDVSTNNYGITLSAGNFTISGGSFTAHNGTVTFSSSSGNQYLNAGGSSFYNVVHSGTSQLGLSSNGVTISNNFTNSTGTFSAGSLATTITGLTNIAGGTYSVSNGTQTFSGGLTIGASGAFTDSTGAINVAGNFSNSGTFTSGTSTVTLNGTNQTISGSTTFYNLTKTVTSADTLTFTDGTTQTITNALTLQGASGQLLTLAGTSTAGWTLAVPSTFTLDYLSVRYSTATTNTAAATHSTNGGNNTNWTFSGSNTAPTFSAISNTAGYIKSGSTVTFTSTASDPDSDNITLYVCKANDFTGTACGAGGQWCSSSASASNPSCSYTVTGADVDGSHTYYANVIDAFNLGSASNPRSSTFTTDSTPPNTTDDYSSNNVWVNSNQTITLTPADATSGVTSTKYCTDASNTCDPTTGTAYTVPVVFSTESTTYFRYESTDNAGNVQITVSRTVKIDKTKPTVSAGIDQSHNASFTQTATCSDAASGCNPSTYRWAKVSGPGSVSFGSPASLATTISATQDGAYVISFVAQDNASNSATSTFALNWITTAPTTQATGTNAQGSYIFGSWSTSSITTTLACTPAAGATCQITLYCTDSANTCTPSITYNSGVTVTTGGITYLRYLSTDSVLNNEGTESSQIKIDNTPPTVSAGSSSSQSSQFTQTGTASDATSGIASYQWSQTSGPGTITFGSPTTIATSIVGQDAGTYVIRLTATDNAGNSNYSEFTLSWMGYGAGGGGSDASFASSVAANTVSNPFLSALLPSVVVTSPPPVRIVTLPRYLGPGDHGSDVLILQHTLQSLGFLPTTITPNGHYGKATTAAIKKFQKAHGIRQTGNVGPVTLRALNGL